MNMTRQRHNVIHVICERISNVGAVLFYFFLASNNFNRGKECYSILNGKPSLNNTENKSTLCQIIRITCVSHVHILNSLQIYLTKLFITNWAAFKKHISAFVQCKKNLKSKCKLTKLSSLSSSKIFPVQ